MVFNIRQLWIILAVHLFSVSTGYAEKLHWVTLSTVNARPAAMGGAFFAVEDRWAGIHWNPAAFGNAFDGDSENIGIRINPAGPLVLLQNTKGVDSHLAPLSLCIQGMILHVNRICIGFLTGEENLSDRSRLYRSDLLDGRRYEWSRHIDVAVQMKLAAKVHMGAAIQKVIHGSGAQGRGWGYRYGILIRPKPYLQAGFCYYNIDNDFSDDRLNIERIADETLNIGLALNPAEWILLTADIRNVSDDGSKASREPHFGMELKPFKALSIRGGYFYNREDRRSAYTMGAGIHSRPMDWSIVMLNTVRVGLDAAYVIEKDPLNDLQWGFISLLLEI